MRASAGSPSQFSTKTIRWTHDHDLDDYHDDHDDDPGNHDGKGNQLQKDALHSLLASPS